MSKFFSFINDLSIQKKIGLLFLLSVLIVNQYVWLWFFDNDGYLKEINKIRFLILNILLIVIGASLFFFKFELKKIVKQVLYFVYFILFFELASFLAIKALISSNEKVKRNISYFLSDNTSMFVPDLRTDYKPNKDHPEINKFGFRSGGKPHTKESFRIMCIGGSTTWGDGAKDSSTTYPAQLEFFLRSKGYNVDVINAGVPYQTSLDVLMRFITKGLIFRPNMLLIHTGLNDNGPVQSPFEYKPDYSHWRKVGDNNKILYKKLWNDFPFSIPRLFFVLYLNFDSSNTVSQQTSNVRQELMAKTLITQKRTEGLKNYFSTILAVAKANNIVPFTIKINNDHNRKNSYAKRYFKEENLEYAIERDKKITFLHNSIMDSISIANKVKIIPFDEFEPSSQQYWYDNCHLTEAGIKEKAEFIGKYLLREFSFPKE